MYTFCIHLMYPFCTSNLDHSEVYNKYTPPRDCILIINTFCTQKYTFCPHVQKVYFLQVGGCLHSYRYKGIHFVYMDAETMKIPGNGMHYHPDPI